MDSQCWQWQVDGLLPILPRTCLGKSAADDQGPSAESRFPGAVEGASAMQESTIAVRLLDAAGEV